MGEVNGQILGVLLVIAIFGVVGAAVTATIMSLTSSLEEKTNEVIDGTINAKAIDISGYTLELQSY